MRWSRTLFGKAPHGLNNREATVAAALVRGPSARPVDVARRACGVLLLMQQTAADGSCEGLESEVQEALGRKAFDPSQGIAEHVEGQVLAEWDREGGNKAGAQEIATTLRAPLQRFAAPGAGRPVARTACAKRAGWRRAGSGQRDR